MKRCRPLQVGELNQRHGGTARGGHPLRKGSTSSVAAQQEGDGKGKAGAAVENGRANRRIAQTSNPPCQGVGEHGAAPDCRALGRAEGTHSWYHGWQRWGEAGAGTAATAPPPDKSQPLKRKLAFQQAGHAGQAQQAQRIKPPAHEPGMLRYLCGDKQPSAAGHARRDHTIALHAAPRLGRMLPVPPAHL